MKTNTEDKEVNQNGLLFDFTVDKAAKTVYVKREFAADLSLVWDAFTKKELLDQWWAPEPWKSKSKVMDFKVGGRRFYAMVSPDGAEEKWAVQKYTSITPKTNFKFQNAFSDKDENPELPGSDWDLTFSEHTAADGSPLTKVSVTIYNESFERMEKLMDGFKMGFTMTMIQLEKLLAAAKR
jgi:uncharacterized protein YndB with AHSA1/START domain